MSGSREGYQENVVVSVGVMIVFSLFAGKGGLSGHKHIYWNLIWQDLRGFIIFFLLSTAMTCFDMDGSFDVPPPLIALWTSTSYKQSTPRPFSLSFFLSVVFFLWPLDFTMDDKHVHTHK